MNDPDVLRVRRPGPLVRLVGMALCLVGVFAIAQNVMGVVDGGWSSAIFVVFCVLEVVTLAYGFWVALLMTLLRWETVVDRRSRTVTRRVRLLWTIKEDRFRFEDFKAVVLRRVGNDPPDRTNPTFSIVLLGPDVRLDLDDPDQVPLAALFRLVVRLSAASNPAGQLALAAELVEFTGLKYRDITGLRSRAISAPRRPAPWAWPMDDRDAVLEIPRVPWVVRAFSLFLLVDALFLVFLSGGNLLGFGPIESGDVFLFLFFGAIATVSSLGLFYRSLIMIDFQSGVLRRRGSIFRWKWDESFSLDQFEAVLVRETKVPYFKTPGRTVHLFEGRYAVDLYMEKLIPRGLRTSEPGLDRGQRCLASAETLASRCGLPMRVVAVDVAWDADHGHAPSAKPVA